MKKIMIALLAFSFLAGTTVFAQDKMDSSTTTKKKSKKGKKKADKSTEAPKAQ